MKKILLLGAGKSSSYLMRYLQKEGEKNQWILRIGDKFLEHARKVVGNAPNVEIFDFDLADSQQTEEEVKAAELVISLLPAHLHIEVAKAAVRFKKNMVTASYISDNMAALDESAKSAGICILNEIGLDPGIDHLSAQKIIDKLKAEGAEITGFLSFCGGLVHPDFCRENPWKYKFTWNPRNVILAGQGTAKYLENAKIKYTPYQRLFKTKTTLPFSGFPYGFEGYPNRDSLKYRKAYGLENVQTMMRGTIRAEGFMRAWQILVDLGLTDDSFICENTKGQTYRDWTASFVPDSLAGTLEERIAALTGLRTEDSAMKTFLWTGLLSDDLISLENATPAQILQNLLEKKFFLEEKDKDLVLMQHQFFFTKNQKNYRIISSLVVTGEDQIYTAMAKTVGLPLAVAVKMILTGKLTQKGVILPLAKEIYEPILAELETFDIQFKDTEEEI
jgi:saccharopine dehydrogenase (NADP+, L-glutamate forming)